MNPANITRQEALHRSSNLIVRGYDVTVDLAGHALDGSMLAEPDETFISTSVIAFAARSEPTWVDLIADHVLMADLDGQPIDPASYRDYRLPISPDEGEHTLRVIALCRYSHTGEGLHRFVDPADDRVYLYSQFETADARRMYANFEQPDLKASFKLTVMTPQGWRVISNAAAAQPAELDNGGLGWQFEPTQPISTYLTALVAGEYHVEPGEINAIGGAVPASLVCRQSMVPYLDSAKIRETTQRGFEIYEQAFGVGYAFGTYDQVFVPQYNAGAMENAGCVTLRDEYLFRSKVTSASYEMRDNTILHELAHMWFGDLVTMRWWDDLWLNESFAEWASHYCQNEIVKLYGGIDPWVSFGNGRKGWAYRQDQLPTTHPVAADMVDLQAVEQNFDGITYAKGASVLKQLVAFVGEGAFLAGVRNYFAEHAFGNTDFKDLLSALQAASGRDLSGFAGDWLETSGVNTVRADFDVDEQGNFTRFDIVQSGETLRSQRIAIGLYELGGAGLVCVDSLEVDIHGERTPIAALFGHQRPDVVLLNDRDLSYCKVRLDPESLVCLIEHVGDAPDPLARSVMFTSAWDMWRDAELGSRDYIDLVLRGVACESDLTGVKTRLGTAQLAATGYSAPENRDANRAHLVAGLVTLLRDAEPGGDHQLAFADALVTAVFSSTGADLIKGWLKGEEVPEGLLIDTDRRWTILTALARMGQLDPELLTAELELDNTISGTESAAGVRAALADADSKAQAWRLATQDASVPNGTYSAICEQFWQYGQETLLATYPDRYLELAEQISAEQGAWKGRGHASKQTALTWLWPDPLASHSFIDKVDDWLGSRQLAEPVKHVISERRDQALRALRAQEVQ